MLLLVLQALQIKDVTISSEAVMIIKNLKILSEVAEVLRFVDNILAKDAYCTAFSADTSNSW